MGKTIYEPEAWPNWQELERLKEKYDQLFFQEEGAEHQQRNSGRLQVPPGKQVFIHREPEAVPLHDISLGGLSFLSDHPIPPGTAIQVSTLGSMVLQAQVVNCAMEAADGPLMECQYRVRARFSQGVNGVQAYSLIREVLGPVDITS
ncbi:MAG: PilZ domain-containing protein [Deltaproteobacteria bacterium]|nr:PilZ domain-containing protein [Deltaproteobacteria bacterium]